MVKFNKLALAAATFAALGGASVASADVSSIPGEAYLVPLFTYEGANNAATQDTVVRITVPRSIGGDTAINAVTPNLTKPSAETTKFADLTTTAPTGSTAVSLSTLHWFFLDNGSSHVADGTINVSADYTTTIKASTLLANAGGVKTGYLVLTTQKAYTGSAAANFAFAADAWLQTPITNNSGAVGYPAIAPIPTYALSDGADTTTYPTQTNNVIETINNTGLYPVASPLITGTRTGVVGNNAPLRVVDVPLVREAQAQANNQTADNVVVFWNDRNQTQVIPAYIFDNAENSASFTLSAPKQLNVYAVDAYQATPGSATPVLNYGVANSTIATAPSIPYPAAGTGLGGEAFIKLFIQAPAAPAGASQAYASAAIFSIPLNPALTQNVSNNTLNALDVGTFATQ